VGPRSQVRVTLGVEKVALNFLGGVSY